jgi:hypothetical protein
VITLVGGPAATGCPSAKQLLAVRIQRGSMSAPEDGLDGEQPQQQERDAIEQRTIAAEERRIQQLTDDEREGEPDARASDQCDQRDEKARAVGPDPGPEAGQPARPSEAPASGRGVGYARAQSAAG